MDRNWAVVHPDRVNHPGGESVAKSDRSLAILTGDDEIPVSRLDFWHDYDHLALLEHSIHHFRRGQRTEARHGAKRTLRQRRRDRLPAGPQARL